MTQMRYIATGSVHKRSTSCRDRVTCVPLLVPANPAAPTAVRTFDTGASRDTETGKLDYEGFLSPRVLKRYAEFMHKHRQLPDGSLRDSDNWQKGIPRKVYMKSAWRHFMDWWRIHRSDGEIFKSADLEEAICALIFNAVGYLHEYLKKRGVEE